MGGRIPPASNASLAVSSAGGSGGHSPLFSVPAGGEMPPSASAEKMNFSDLRKQFLPLFAGGLPAQILLKKKSKFSSLLRYCSGRSATTELSFEDESSDVVIQVEDMSLGSSVLSSSIRKNRKLQNAEDKATISTTISNNASTGGVPVALPVCLPPKATPKFRSRGNQPIPIICTPPPQTTATVGAADDNANGTITNSPPPATPTSLHSYKMLIEYCGVEGKRPSVRLSSAASQMAAAANAAAASVGSERNALFIQCTQNADAWRKLTSFFIDAKMNGNLPADADPVGRGASFRSAGAWLSYAAAMLSPSPVDFDQSNEKQRTAANTSVSMKEEFLRKSEKERRKNERRQESKAAKTLSAILFAFIITWTPYNVIVCWEAFFPNSIPDTLFTISYCLCYVNSTINPVCYALCNARFRMTFLRIMRCASWRKFNKSSLYQNAYLKRN